MANVAQLVETKANRQQTPETTASGQNAVGERGASAAGAGGWGDAGERTTEPNLFVPKVLTRCKNAVCCSGTESVYCFMEITVAFVIVAAATASRCCRYCCCCCSRAKIQTDYNLHSVRIFVRVRLHTNKAYLRFHSNCCCRRIRCSSVIPRLSLLSVCIPFVSFLPSSFPLTIGPTLRSLLAFSLSRADSPSHLWRMHFPPNSVHK